MNRVDGGGWTARGGGQSAESTTENVGRLGRLGRLVWRGEGLEGLAGQDGIVRSGWMRAKIKGAGDPRNLPVAA